MCISANFCCSYLRYYFLCLSYQGLFRGRRAKRLMATGPCHGGWGAAIINFPPPAQQTAPVPPPLWVEVRARFRFYRVPWCPMAGAAEFHHCHAVFFCNEVSFRKTRYTIEYPWLKQFVYTLFTQKSEGISYPTQALHSTLIKPFCWLSINCLRYLSLFISSISFLIFANIGTFR